MERPGQGSPLPSDPVGREDIVSDEQAERENVSPDDPDVIRDAKQDVIRDAKQDVIRDAKRPDDAAAAG